MRLGHTAKYALQALAFLIKCHARDEWGQIADIAREGNIPRKYLEQVLLDLKGAGLVESKKGQHGGYRLSRAPHEISLAQVVAAVQGELVPVPDWLEEGSEDGFATEYGLRDVVQQRAQPCSAFSTRLQSKSGLSPRRLAGQRNGIGGGWFLVMDAWLAVKSLTSNR
jgi:Rrf2 family protein